MFPRTELVTFFMLTLQTLCMQTYNYHMKIAMLGNIYKTMLSIYEKTWKKELKHLKKLENHQNKIKKERENFRIEINKIEKTIANIKKQENIVYK